MESGQERQIPLNFATKKHFNVFLLTICCLGLILRLIIGGHLKEIYPPVTNPTKTTDMFTYQNLSKQVLEGTFDYSKGFYYQPFYYTVYLPAIYKFIGDSPQVVLVVQSILGAISIYLIGLAFAMIFGKMVGLLTGGFTALNRTLIFYTPFTLIATLQAFWLSLILYLSLIAFKDKKSWKWLIVGFAFGAAILTRGNVLLFLPLFPLLIFFSLRNRRTSLIFGILFFLAGMIIPQMPYSIVNHKAGKGFIGASSAGAAVLALGNTPESPPGGREAYAGAGPMDYPESCTEWTKEAYALGKENVPIHKNIFTWIKREPFAFLELKFRMFLLFWNRVEIPNNVAISTFGKPLPSKILNSPLLIDFLWVGTFGLFGIIYSLTVHPGNKKILFSIALILLYCLGTVLFYILARFRLPIVPILCGFSAYGFISLYREFRSFRLGKSRWMKIGTLGMALFACFLFVGIGFDSYRNYWEKRILRIVRPHGVQIKLTNKNLIMDHGPMTFGGWRQMPVQPPITVRKMFSVNDHFIEGGKIFIRFPVSATESTSIDYSLSSGPSDETSSPRELSVDRGFHWIEEPIHPEFLGPQSDSLELRMKFSSNSEKVVLFFDTQRFYGRTQFNGKVDRELGEMVIDLIIRPSSQTHTE